MNEVTLDEYYNAEITLSVKCADCGGCMVVDSGSPALNPGAWAENKKYIVAAVICAQCGNTGTLGILLNAPSFGANDEIPF
jgi:hypothetical protein